jgi:hypothetical protein
MKTVLKKPTKKQLEEARRWNIFEKPLPLRLRPAYEVVLKQAEEALAQAQCVIDKRLK